MEQIKNVQTVLPQPQQPVMPQKRQPVSPPLASVKTVDYRRRGRRYKRMSTTLTYLILLVVSVMMLSPFAWLLSASLKSVSQYYAVPIQWIPQPFVWQNYLEVFTQYNFGHYILNSFWLASFATVVSTFMSALVAYGFARFRFPGRTAWFICVLGTMMMPAQILTIPLYQIFKDLGWLDTYLPLMIPQLFGSAFSIFLFRQFFLNLSRELDEAARIDGCSSLRIFWNIILPQSKPVIIVVGVFTFLASWRDAWGPLIYLSSNDNRTVPLGLLFFTNPYETVYPQLMAATVIALAVPVILYAIGQRYIDRGVAIAEIK
jgi:ABC-type glycerol-3-phosphate transport system permease component